MPGDFLGGLGGLMKGLSGFMPQDDPEVKMFNVQSEVDDLKKQETQLLAQIGQKAIAEGGIARFGELGEQLKLVQTNLAAAEGKLKTALEEKDAKDKAEKEEEQKYTCPDCGTRNPDGVKFCQECGAKLGIVKAFCPNCGAENPAGTRFCGGCGTKIAQ